MFNRNNDNSNQSAPPPGLPPGPIPMPTIRVFEVTRYSEDGNDLEKFKVHAHAVAIGDNNRTVFQTWKIDPVIGPQLQVTRIMIDVLEVEDVTLAPVEDNRIIH